MRTIRLGRMFDAVLVHDAVDYVTEADDLRQLIGTAFAHCRPGGMAVFVPDYTAETFEGGTGGGGGTGADGRQGSFREWTWDPDPADDWIQVEYEFALRAADGAVQVVREAHRLGAFSRALWLRLLAGAGFEPEALFAGEFGAGEARGRDPGGRGTRGRARPGAAAARECPRTCSSAGARAEGRTALSARRITAIGAAADSGCGRGGP